MFSRFWLLVLVLTASWISSVQAGLEVFERPVARYFFAETKAGRAFIEKFLGRPVAVASDLTPLMNRLSLPKYRTISTELETEIVAMERELQTRFPRLDFSQKNGSKKVWSREREIPFLQEISEGHLARVNLSRVSTIALNEGEAVAQILGKRLKLIAGDLTPKLRYPKGISAAAEPKGYIQFGFESEYTLKEAEKLLTVYGPHPSFGISSEAWFVMPLADRGAWMRTNLNALFPAERTAGGLIKLDHSPEWAFLPEALIKDSTGNLEIVMKPLNTLEDWIGKITRLNQKFGAGSMQGTVSVPPAAFYGRGSEISLKAMENYGFLVFFNELDTLQKLQAGAERFLVDANRATVNTFKHPFLGPLTQNKQNLLREYLEANARGEMFDEAAMKFVAGSDASFKYVGGTAYRPDILPGGRVILEVRDAHANTGLLMERMYRVTHYLQKGRAPFAGASSLQAFDAKASFDRLSVPVQKMLKKLYPAPMRASETYSRAEQEALKVYRNFAYPLRDWSAHLNFLGSSEKAAKISEAQAGYMARLRAIEKEWVAGRLTDEQASFQIQGSLTLFVDETGMAHLLKGWLLKALSNSPARSLKLVPARHYKPFEFPESELPSYPEFMEVVESLNAA